MAGTSDPICSLTATHILSSGIRDSQTILFENASHFFLMEQADKFNHSLLAWLNSH